MTHNAFSRVAGKLSRREKQILSQAARNYCRGCLKSQRNKKLKYTCSTFWLRAILALSLVPLTYAPFSKGVFGQETKKAAPKEKPNFEDSRRDADDEDAGGAMCMSAKREARDLGALVTSYSRRLGACSMSDTTFRNDCSTEFRVLVVGYNRYQLALSSVREYCK
jgi:hypothetical protein